MKILLVEDDQPTGSALTETLTAHQYTVTLATDGQTGLELAEAFHYDLILLDIVIPKLDGISLCKRLRAHGHQTPILLLTAKDSRSDEIMGLDAGADDWVVKPYDSEALLARIRALLRRGKVVSAPTITWENIQVDPSSSDVTCNDRPVHLTPKEYCLLELFLLNPKRIYSRRAILDRLWDFAESPGEETVSTHIKCLRQKLKAAGACDPIETVHGLGYRLKAPDPAKEKLFSAEPPAAQAASTRQEKVTKITTRVWEKFKDQYVEKINLLEQVAHSLNTPQFSDDLHQQARLEAHKLAGALGIFGLERGSQLAREIERLLELSQPLKPDQIQHFSKLVPLLQQAIQRQSDDPVPEVLESAYAPLVLIIDDDLTLAEHIRIEAIAWNLRVEIATDLRVARKMIAQTPPDVILLDLTFPSATEDGLTLLRELSHRAPKIPVLVFTGREDLADRVAVARLGAYAFLHKPLSVHQILKAVTDALKQQHLNNRVMVVDDDINLLSSLKTALKPLGIDVVTLNNSAQFWESLTTSKPDLLVLDLEMPNFSGLELCQVVRNDPEWRNLPILFFSAHHEEGAITQAYAAGADDYISKSNNLAELTTCILHRLKRN